MPSLNNILFGPPGPENITEGTKSLGEFCLNHLNQGPNITLLENYETEEQISLSAFRIQAIRVAQCLTQYGFKSGDKIGVFSENNIEFCSVIFGTIFIGATIVPISPFFTEIELRHAYSLSKPTIFFVSTSTLDKFLKFADNNPSIKHIIVFGETKKCQSFHSFLDNVPEKNIENFTCAPQDLENNVALILSSSGTTGLPKGVEITQRNILAATVYLNDTYKLVQHSVVMAPFSYISGFMFMFPAVVRPIKTTFLEKFDAYKYLRCIEKLQMPFAFFNQTIMNLLAKKPIEKEFNLSSLSLVVYAGACISQNAIAEIEEKLPNLVLLQNYAITECFSISGQTITMCTPGSIGVLQNGSAGKVVDTKTGQLLGPNEIGELMFKNRCLMKGYVGNVEATEKAFDIDGFFHTGDIGYYNENGEWFIVDRIKELIKYCGMQVYPAEIESVLMGHPMVRDVCVVGLPDDECGELPMAFVVRQSDITSQEIIDYIAERLSSPQHLRGGVVFIDKMPENNSGSGKSHRKLLRDLAINMTTRRG